MLILSVFVFWDSSKQKMPGWWAAITFFAPVTVPFYFFKTRAGKGIVPVVISLFILLPVCLAEYHFYTKEKAERDYLKLPPAAQQMMELSYILKQQTDDLLDDIDELEKMSKTESRLEVMGDTIAFIGAMKVNLIRIRALEQRLSVFRYDYDALLKKEGLFWLSEVRNFYDNAIIVQHMKSLSGYLDAFETSLQYVFTNYKKIEARSYRHLQNYDAYYLKYRRSVDRHNAIYSKRILFQNQYLKKKPKLKSYLPDHR